MLSLFVRRRRVWVRAAAGDDGRTLVEVAGLARTEAEGGEGLTDEVRVLAEQIGTTS
jgi:cytochrome c biogenesis protein